MIGAWTKMESGKKKRGADLRYLEIELTGLSET